MGAGYNIPVSLSSSDASNVAPNVIAGTNINFSGNLDAGTQKQSNDPYMPSTAVSSASQRDASAGVGGIGGPPGDMQKFLLIGGIAVSVIAIAVTIYAIKKRKA